MTELETLSARLEEAVKKQTEADEAYHKAAEEVESIKAEMVRVKNKREKELQICLGYLFYL
nr:MAG TPA: hypothetical protein [Caudoviricetes sp.]